MVENCDDKYLKFDLEYNQVHTFNDMPVDNLKSLASMVENCDDEYLKFRLEYNQLVVLHTEHAKAATLDILTTLHIIVHV
ncbi:hypothetical protein ACFX2J_023280 [Malus domestica]